MKSLFLLIVLTQNGAGDINVSFVNTQTLAQCQNKALLVKDIFSGSNIPVLASRCISSELQFSEFGHASVSSKIRNYYLVKFDENSVQIENMPDWHACMSQAQQATGPGKVYCSSSVQSSVE